MDPTGRAIVAGVFFLLIVLSGLWLSRAGRPLNVGISTVHKLISLAAGIYLLVIIHQRNQVVPLNTTEWITSVITGLCFLGTVVSGGFLSAEKPMPAFVLRVHQVGPVLATFFSAVTLYLVLGH